MDKEIQSQLYDPKKRRSAWLSFVIAHKHIRLPGGRINLKAISKLWHAKSKAYDLISTKEQAYRALKIAAERIGNNNYKHQIAEWKKSHKSLKNFKFYVTPEHKQLIKAMPEVLSGKLSPEAAMSLLHQYDTMKQRLNDPHRLIESKKEGGKELHESKDHYHSHIKIYDPVKHGAKATVPRWFEAMVQGIKTRSDVRNPFAIVEGIWGRLSPSKRLQIKRREMAGKPFKYDLPLPDDRATHGTGTLRMVKPFKLAEVQVNVSLKDYLAALKSGLFQKMKRGDGTTALVARCKSDKKNCNIFVDKDVK